VELVLGLRKQLAEPDPVARTAGHARHGCASRRPR
jgi:hypothetical protein